MSSHTTHSVQVDAESAFVLTTVWPLAAPAMQDRPTELGWILVACGIARALHERQLDERDALQCQQARISLPYRRDGAC